MSAVTATARGRRAAEALMVDAVVVKRKTGESTDADTGVVTRTYSTIYSGKCKIQQRAGVARPSSVGEAEVFLSRLEMHVPASVTGIATDDIATITASALDADLVNRVFHVRELAHKSFATARRYSIIEVTS